MTTVVCPYCFSRTAAARLPFRCLMPSTGLRGSVRCAAVSDDVWAEFKGPGLSAGDRMRGPVFPAPRQFGGLRPTGLRAACPHCGAATPVRVCPGCHSDLPSDYCDQESRIIALLGAKASGKSTYVTVLVNELRHRVGSAYQASLVPMGGETQRRDRELAEDLYERLRLPEATRPAAMGFNDPLMYRLSVPGTGRRAAGSRHTALVFFDAAGEDLSSAEAMNRYTRYLGAADGIVLLVDPLQFGSVRDSLPNGAGADLPAVETSAQQIAADLAGQLRAHGRGDSKGRVSTPLAVAVTKVDMLSHLLEPHSPLLRSAEHHGGTLDRDDLAAVREETSALLTACDSGALRRQLERDFAELGLFGLSALGAPPPLGAPADAPASGPRPLRVEDPLLWLLARRDLIPVRKPAGRRVG
ncbi:TRAFAC clade GTPase domain-containing protein [Streptacidiphilus carbonis]|uniref:TRAFAC clade GTPase domain-containing protein n=1 Tax=Streptacidiphilus carbonis TaxID=105422 RepID=UPI0005A8FCAB|nr:zinc ribbon domain-containing protein [Streptacidiphilus carbonis]